MQLSLRDKHVRLLRLYRGRRLRQSARALLSSTKVCKQQRPQGMLLNSAPARKAALKTCKLRRQWCARRHSECPVSR